MAKQNRFSKLFKLYEKLIHFKQYESECQKCYIVYPTECIKNSKNILKCSDCDRSFICNCCFIDETKQILKGITNETTKRRIVANMKKNYKCRLCIYVKIQTIMYPEKKCTELELFRIKLLINSFMFTALSYPKELYNSYFCKHISKIIKDQKEDYTAIDFLNYDEKLNWYNDNCVYCNLSMMIFGGYYNYVGPNPKYGLEHYCSLLDDIISLDH